ncbi:glycosyltransferase family 87 protein [Bradyrhizobium elkanii]
MKKILHWDASAGDDPALMVACAVLFGVSILLSIPAFFGGAGQAGIDFSCFWGAGAMALEGHAAAAYDWEQLHQQLVLRLQSLNHAPYPYDQVPVPFFYPPVFFLVVAPLALLPFPIAFWVWSAAKLSCWLLVVHAIRPRSAALLLALAAPPVFYDFISGQSALLAASLLGGILLTLDRRSLLSGILIALLIFKPQYGVLLPFVLIATGRWRVVITAALMIPVLLLLAGLIFGWDTFDGFRAGRHLRHDAIPPQWRAAMVQTAEHLWSLERRRPWLWSGDGISRRHRIGGCGRGADPVARPCQLRGKGRKPAGGNAADFSLLRDLRYADPGGRAGVSHERQRGPPRVAFGSKRLPDRGQRRLRIGIRFPVRAHASRPHDVRNRDRADLDEIPARGRRDGSRRGVAKICDRWRLKHDPAR